MSIRARLRTTTSLAVLVIIAAIIVSVPFGAATALRSWLACFRL
jgi:ABC-type dipeptide/oligopeptide/nickel transport system permease component